MNLSVVDTLLLGDHSAPEMHEVVAGVRQATGGGLRTAADLCVVRRFVRDEAWHPRLIVALETWSERFSSTDALEVLSLAPLARIVCVYGAWCDSDGRSRNAWPMAVRVPVSHAPARIARELASIRITAAVAPAAPHPLPWTASRAEIFAADFGAPLPAGSSSAGVAALSPDRRFREMLEAALRGVGCRVAMPDDSRPPAALVFDADPWNSERGEELRALRTAHPRTRLVAAVGFPRADSAARLCAAGADAIWAKLAPLAMLLPLV